DSGKPYWHSFDENGTAHYYSHNKISASLAAEAFSRLKSDKKTAETVCTLVMHHDAPLPDSEKLIKRRLRQFGEENFFRLIEVHKADTAALNPEFTKGRAEELETIRLKTQEILLHRQCFCLKDLAVNGNDVQSAGYSGREIGEALEKLLSAVTDGRLPNERGALIDYIKR
ncbi:MAG: tRNA nucleotidyltransferase, partial [Clostridia bacterium]|nr:tRNA nucleotidyltransferase [Clostridia bacterium]